MDQRTMKPLSLFLIFCHLVRRPRGTPPWDSFARVHLWRKVKRPSWNQPMHLPLLQSLLFDDRLKQIPGEIVTVGRRFEGEDVDDDPHAAFVRMQMAIGRLNRGRPKGYVMRQREAILAQQQQTQQHQHRLGSEWRSGTENGRPVKNIPSDQVRTITTRRLVKGIQPKRPGTTTTSGSAAASSAGTTVAAAMTTTTPTSDDGVEETVDSDWNE